MQALRCACGHRESSHHLTGGKRRTWCRVHMGPDGVKCECKLFEEVVDVRRGPA